LLSTRKKTKGWFVLSRDLFDGDISRDPVLLAIWVTLLACAQHEDSSVKLGRQQVRLKRGQLCTSALEIARQFSVSRSVARRCLEYLETSQRIGQQKSQHGTIITILNYDVYQDFKNYSANGSANGSANTRPTVGQHQANGRPHTNELTNEQNNELTPPNPQRGKRGSKSLAVRLADNCISHYTSQKNPKPLDSRAEAFIIDGFGTLNFFKMELFKANKDGCLRIFRAHLRESIEAYLIDNEG